MASVLSGGFNVFRTALKPSRHTLGFLTGTKIFRSWCFQFTSMLALLQAALEKEGIPYYIITGETSKQKRQELVKQFNSDTTPVFLISLKAGGVGLNLTGADVVIHYDPWWNQAVQNQATDRAHRIGQTKKVTVYKLIARNTIEEKIQKLQEAKQDLAEQIISGDMGQLSGMSREDILELL